MNETIQALCELLDDAERRARDHELNAKDWAERAQERGERELDLLLDLQKERQAGEQRDAALKSLRFYRWGSAALFVCFVIALVVR